MGWFTHLKVSKKLALGFGLILLLMVGIGAFSLGELARVNSSAVDLAVNRVPCMRALANIRYDTTTLKGQQLSFLLSDPKETALRKEQIDSQQKKLAEDFNRYEPFIASPEERTLYEQYRASLSRFYDIHSRVLQLQAEGRHGDAVRLAQGEGRDTVDAAIGKISEDLQLNVKRGEAAALLAANVYSSARLGVAGLLCAGILLTTILTVTITRSIVNPVYATRAVLECLANRDLTKTVDRDANDELGAMARALNRTIDALRATISTIGESAEHLASASEEISATAGQTAAGAKTQSDQSLQVATAMQEMSATVLEISRNSHRASAASRDAAEAARHGGKVVEETLSTMRGIAESTAKAAATISELGKSSEQIGKIVSVIDDIADQTNLLALNAAIEAARAGEQGRGFAVVADEVRKLAERTTRATKEIAGMIETIQQETRNAVEVMQQGNANVGIGLQKTSASGAALQQIISMAEEVGDMIATIATAATEQSAATEQINSGVAHISSSSQAASAASEETAKACTDLSTLAFSLQNLVSQFKLTSANGGGRQPAPIPSLKSKPAAAGSQ